MEEAPKILWLWTVMQPWDSCSHFIDTLRALVEAVQAWSIEYQEAVYEVVESAMQCQTHVLWPISLLGLVADSGMSCCCKQFV